MRYPTIFEPAEEGGFNVSFPSFPGCVTFGRDFEEAKIKAREVLELWLEELSDWYFLGDSQAIQNTER